jgi:hypothetical protein
VTDANQRNILLGQAGKILVEQVQKHPYHARVHYLYGFYWSKNDTNMIKEILI